MSIKQISLWVIFQIYDNQTKIYILMVSTQLVQNHSSK